MIGPTDVVQSVDINAMDGAAALQKFAAPRHTEYVLTGSYWEEKAGLKFMASLQSEKNGRVMAGAEVLVPLEIIQDGGALCKPCAEDTYFTNAREVTWPDMNWVPEPSRRESAVDDQNENLISGARDHCLSEG